MAFLLPIVEGLVELGEVVGGALLEAEVGETAVAAGTAATAVDLQYAAVSTAEAAKGFNAAASAAADYDGAMATEDLAQYEADYYRMPSEEGNNGYEVVPMEDAYGVEADEGGIGYAIEGAPEVNPYYYGEAGDIPYLSLAQKADDGYILSNVFNDPSVPHQLILIGAGKAIFVAW